MPAPAGANEERAANALHKVRTALLLLLMLMLLFVLTLSLFATVPAPAAADHQRGRAATLGAGAAGAARGARAAGRLRRNRQRLAPLLRARVQGRQLRAAAKARDSCRAGRPSAVASCLPFAKARSPP